jgi:uncharacterized repeat protein (TIGR03847 family)
LDWELSALDLLSPIAVGAPGKRSFFLVISEKGRWFRVWLEKQDLQALGMAIGQLALKLSSDAIDSLSVQEKEPAHETSRFPAAELQLREANLGFEDGHGGIALTVDIIGPRRQDECSLRFYPTVAQLKQFAKRAEEVCAAGRPICPICGEAMDSSGHDCPGGLSLQSS